MTTDLLLKLLESFANENGTLEIYIETEPGGECVLANGLKLIRDENDPDEIKGLAVVY